MKKLRYAAARILAAIGHRYPFIRGRWQILEAIDRVLAPGDYLIPAKLNHSRVTISICRPDRVGLSLFAFGEDDPDLFRVLTAAMQVSTQAQPMFIDVGANLGTFSIRLARNHRCETLSFEPQPRLARLLAENAAANGVEKLVRIERFALGETEGESEFFINSGHLGSSGMLATAAAQKVVVPVRRMDEIVSPEDWRRAAVLKVDVEGFEREVFKGAGRLFEIARPPIVFELNRDSLDLREQRPIEVIAPLRAAGYRHFFAVGARLFPPENGAYRIANIVAVTGSDDPLVQACGFDPAGCASARRGLPVEPIEL